MLTSNKTFYILGVMLLALSASAPAQNRHKKKDAPEKETAAIADFYPTAARLVVIDSIVADKDSFAARIPLRKEYGKIGKCKDIGTAQAADARTSFAYVNGFGDVCIYSRHEKNDSSCLFVSDKTGNSWGKEKAIKEFMAEFADADYPYLMPDGITLYFSATGDRGFGKRDIYVARLNTEDNTFYKPENAGLPYNSVYNDYMCVIDDTDSIGWLVTDRYQPEGKGRIYTFIPSDERWSDDNALTATRLKSVAELHSVKDTQTDPKAVERARQRYRRMLEAHTAASHEAIRFAVNDNTVYTSESDFKSETGKALFRQVQQLKKKQAELQDRLCILRQEYRKNRSKTVAATILNMEEETENNSAIIKKMEKKIRNAENL